MKKKLSVLLCAAMVAASLADNNKRMELFTEAEKLLMDDMPILPLYYLNASLLVKPNVTGMTKNANGHTLFRGADKT